MAQVRQTSFARGELSPLLWGRSDLELYNAGLRRCRDFFPTRQGALMSRPGSVYVAKPYGATSNSRLVPFVYSDNTSYVLVFCESGGASARIYIYSAGVLVATVDPSPYTSSLHIRALRWVQSGNVLTITCPGVAPYQMTRNSHSSWTLTTIDFSRPAAGVNAPDITAPLPSADATHPAREWSWVVTELRKDARGIVTESAPTKLTQLSDGSAIPEQVVVYPDKAVTLNLNYLSPPGLDASFVAYIIYRGRAGLYGMVGQTDSATFVDVGGDPDYARAPPQGLTPYPAAGPFPRAVAYFEERLVFGGAYPYPAELKLSATADYLNFDERLVPVADMALKYELASRKFEEVRHLLGLHQLLVFTSSSVWAFGGVEPLSPEVVPYARVQEEIGCTDLQPLSLEGAALYCRTKGAGVRALRYEQERAGFVGLDLSSMAEHLFQSAETDCRILDWCHAEDPFGLVWACRHDGNVVSLTYSPIDNQWGWALHDFGGLAVSMCSVPEGDEDVVYMLILRTGGGVNTMELNKLASRVKKGTVSDDICVDRAVRWEGVPALTITVPEYAWWTDIYVIGKDNPPVGPLAADSAGNITLPEIPVANNGANAVLWVGQLFQPELETLDAAPSQARKEQKRVTEVVFEVNASKGLYVGNSLEHMKEWRQRTVADGYSLPSAATEVVRTHITGAWSIGGRAALRQTLPLPLTIVGFTREVELGG